MLAYVLTKLGFLSNQSCPTLEKRKQEDAEAQKSKTAEETSAKNDKMKLIKSLNLQELFIYEIA